MRVFQLLFQGVTENYPINRNTNNNARTYSFTVNHNLDKKKTTFKRDFFNCK